MTSLPLSVVDLPPQDVLSQRFHLITGKGGVGKSTVAMTLGLYWASRGIKTLICEVDDREMMTRAFQVEPSKSEIRSLQDRLFAVSIDTQSALSEYGALKLRVKAFSKLLTDNPVTRALISIVPGVADLIALGKAFNHERERDSQGRPLWDRVIIDAPSTGHGLTFLRLPQVIREVVPSGNMRREADEMWSLLSDPTRSAIHVVTTPEELPCQEAAELWQALRAEANLTPQCLWINQVVLPCLTDQEWEAFSERALTSDMHLWIEVLKRRHLRAASAVDSLELLKSIQGPRAHLPLFSTSKIVDLKDHLVRAIRERGEELTHGKS